MTAVILPEGDSSQNAIIHSIPPGEYIPELADFVQTRVTELVKKPGFWSDKRNPYKSDKNTMIQNWTNDFINMSGDMERQSAYLRFCDLVLKGNLETGWPMVIHDFYLSSENHKWIFIDKVVRKYEEIGGKWLIRIEKTVSHPTYGEWNFISLDFETSYSRWFLTDSDFHEDLMDQPKRKGLSNEIGGGSFRWGPTLDDIERWM